MITVAQTQTDLMERWSRKTRRSKELHARAARRLPYGVGSNFRAMEPHPIFVDRARGSRLWDVDGNEYVDFALGFGSLYAGHAHPAIVRAVSDQVHDGTLYAMPHAWEYELAEEVCGRFRLEQVRFTNSGTEATLNALRLARAFTGRPKIVKFEGAFHGGHEAVLANVKAAVLDRPAGDRGPVPASLGIPKEFLSHTLVANFNDQHSVRSLFDRHPGQIAAVIMEPVLLNATIVPPEPGFLDGVARLCRERGALWVLDEVKTGARLAAGGATELWGLKPDLICLAKAIGGGLPLGAFGGRHDVMSLLERGVSHTGTFNTNPLSVRAGLAALREALTPEATARAERLSARLADGYREIIRRKGLPWPVTQLGPMGVLHFTPRAPRDYRDWTATDEPAWERYWFGMTLRGILPQPHGSEEQWSLSVQHTEEDVAAHLAAFEEVAPTLR